MEGTGGIMSQVLNLTEQDFDDALKQDGPILVDFWAEWCGPCKMLSPVLDELATEYGANLRIAKVNVDENPELARRYKVRSIPNLILFKSGEIADQIMGAYPKTDLKSKIDSILG